MDKPIVWKSARIAGLTSECLLPSETLGRAPAAIALPGERCWPCVYRISRSAAGFTLIEMLAVLAVIALLALLAIPNYTERFVRIQIFNALPLATIAEGPVAQRWQNAHSFPVDNNDAGLPLPEKIVSSAVAAVGIENGAIHITFGNSANRIIRGKVLTLRPAVIEDAPIVPVSWVCGSGPVPGMMTLHGVDRTTVPGNLLPVSCRAP